jgi:hypothetical protein
LENLYKKNAPAFLVMKAGAKDLIV